MMADIVLQSPKKLECRYGQEEISVRLQNPADFTKGEIIVLDVLDYIGGENEVEAAVRKR
jgi:hypothetical protein